VITVEFGRPDRQHGGIEPAFAQLARGEVRQPHFLSLIRHVPAPSHRPVIIPANHTGESKRERREENVQTPAGGWTGGCCRGKEQAPERPYAPPRSP
jgi:hypothetical protein